MNPTRLPHNFTQLEVINYIASNASRFDTVVIIADDDRTPLEAIEHLSEKGMPGTWNVAYQEKTLLVY